MRIHKGLYAHKKCTNCVNIHRDLLDIGESVKMNWTSTSRKGGTGAGPQCVKVDKVQIMLLFCKWIKLDLTTRRNKERELSKEILAQI